MGKYSLQVKISVIAKILTAGIGFISVPYLIAAIGVDGYGYWSILLSILPMVALVDLGMTPATRNLLMKNHHSLRQEECAILIGQYYKRILLVVAITAFIVVVFAQTNILETPLRRFRDVSEAKTIFIITVSFALVTVPLLFVESLYIVIKKPARTAITQLTIATVLFLYLYIGSLWEKQIELWNYSVAYGLVTILIYSHQNLDFYRKNREFTPKKIKEVKKSYLIRPMATRFLIMQASVIVIFSTDKFLIGYFGGLDDVAMFDLVSKVFSIPVILYGVISSSLLGFLGEWFEKGNIVELRRMLSKQVKILFLISIVMCILYQFMDLIVYKWTRLEDLDINNILMPTLILSMITIWNGLSSVYLTAASVMQVGTLITASTAILNIPLSAFLAGYMEMGASGVLVASIVCLLVALVISPIQIYVLLSDSVELKAKFGYLIR